MNSEDKKPFIVVVCGPTGIGKTSTAVALAEMFSGEIISSDSMQIYRHMDIGTAKPTPQEKARVFHHLIDVADPDDSFDAAMFARQADLVIKKLGERDKLPIVAGGTGLYIRSLVNGLFRSRPLDRKVMDRLEDEIKTFGAEALHKRLSVCDAEAAQRIHPNDAFRVVRALEVFESTGKTISMHQNEHNFCDNPYHVLKIGLNMDRGALYARINKRVDMMISEGFLDEVKMLLEKGYSGDLKSMQSIGYRHMVDHLTGDVSWDDTVELLKRDTRRYAKRQLTWFRKEPDINWIEPGQVDRASDLVGAFLS